MKKYLCLMLSLLMVLSATLFGCGEQPENPSESVETPIEHTYGSEWSSNSYSHFKAATCEHVQEKFNVEPHTFENGVCTVCGREENLVSLVVKDVDPLFEVHLKLQADYLADTYSNISNYAYGGKALCGANKLKISWKIKDGEKSVEDVASMTLELATSKDFSDALCYEVELISEDGSYSYSVDNLYIATTYYYRVVLKDSEDNILGIDNSVFATVGTAPRTLNVEGVKNVRDIGGWLRADGTRVKQGMIYRCGRLNESSVNIVNVEITEDGIHTMKDILGVKTEIDLRMSKNNEYGALKSSPLGKDVNYVHISTEYSNLSIESASAQIVDFFSVLGLEENYPIIFHCNIGTDRTGLMAFLINALMGVSKQDLYRDYLFSNFAKIGGSRQASTIAGYIESLSHYAGETLSEQAENCLLELGVPADQIATVKKMLTE